MHKFRKTAQPQPRQMPQPGLSLRRPVRPLTAAAQMLDQTSLNMALDLTVGTREGKYDWFARLDLARLKCELTP